MANEFIARKGLIVSGSTRISGSVTAHSFTGSLQGTGSFATTSSFTTRKFVTVTGSAPTNPLSNDLWYDDTTGKTYIYYVSASVGSWVLQADPTFDPAPLLQDFQDVTDLGAITSNVVTISNTTAATNTGSGALLIGGGLGVAGAIHSNTVNATTVTATTINGTLIGTATSASYVTFDNIGNKPTLVSSSSQINTGSFTGSFTGTFTGTGSWAQSSSVAITSSYVEYSNVGNKPSLLSSSTQVDYTQIQNKPTTIATASFAVFSSQSLFAATASYISGGIAIENGLNITGSVNINGSLNVFGGITGSLFGSSSFAASSSQAISSSFASVAHTATSASYLSGSVGEVINFTATNITGSNVQLNGLTDTTATNKILVLNTVTGKIHTTASVGGGGGSGAGFPYTGNAVITGSLWVSGSNNGFSGITGSLLGTSSWAQNVVSASYAQTASYAFVTNPQAFNIDTYEFIGDGTTVNYNIVQSYNLNSLVVSVDGLTYNPTDDYTLSTNTLTFVVAPPSESSILVRAFVNATTGVTGSFSGSFFGLSFVTASFAISASWAPGGAGTVTSITAGDGLTGGTITSTGTITLNTSSVHFLDGVKKELNTEGIISSSTQFNSLTTPFTGSLLGTSSWAVSASWAPGGESTVGPGTVNSIAFFNTANTVSSSIINETNGYIGINMPGSFTNGRVAINAIDDNTILYGSSSTNATANITIKNFRAGTAASTEYIIYNDVGSPSSLGGFTQLGMNSSTFSEAGLIGGAGDAYLFMSSSNVGGKLYVGNATPGSSIRFYAGAFNADPNTRMIVSSSGEVGIGVTSSLGATLRVQGNVSASSYTSSVSNGVGFLGTSSWAQSSSVAISSSFATTSFFAVSASWAPGGAGPGTTFPYTGNAVITGSLQVSGSSGGLSGITGSLFGTASRALTASYAEAFTGFINFPQGLTVTGSTILSGSTTLTVSGSALFANNLTVNGGTLSVDSVTNRVGITGSLGVTGGITGSLLGTATTSSYTRITSSIIYVVDGGGSAITTGVKGDIVVPFACTIQEWTLLADTVGSVTVDIWKDSYANYPPTSVDSITGSAAVSLSSANKNQSSTLTGWTTAIAANDVLRFNVSTAATITRLTITLDVAR